MTKRLFLLTSLLAAVPVFGLAKDLDKEVEAPPFKNRAIAAAKAHVRSFLTSDFDGMAKSYAPKVKLVSGHEMLKAEYGLAGPGGRDATVTTESVELLKAMRKAFDGPLVAEDQLEAFFEKITFTPLETKIGDYAADPPDPVDTPDGKAHFDIEDGDVLVKVGPKKGDFLLFQFRRMKGGWKVVAELLD